MKIVICSIYIYLLYLLFKSSVNSDTQTINFSYIIDSSITESSSSLQTLAVLLIKSAYGGFKVQNY